MVMTATSEVHNPLIDEDMCSVEMYTKNEEKVDEEGEEENLNAVVESKTDLRSPKKIFLHFLVFVLLSSAIDIIVYAFSDKQFSVEESRLVLESNIADAELIMSAHVKLNSFLHSFNVNNGHCQYYYTQEGADEKRQVSDIYGHFEHNGDTTMTQNEVKIQFELHNTDYAQLRHLLWAYHTGSEATTSVDCTAQVTLNAFKLFPIEMNFVANDVLDNQITFQDDFMLEDGGKSRSILKLLQDTHQFLSKTFKVESVSPYEISMEAANTINTINTIDSPFPVKSFVIEMPQLSYSINSVAVERPESVDTGAASRDARIVISNTPVEVDLGAGTGEEEAPFSTILSATCSEVDSEGELLEGGVVGESCGLFSALHIGTFVEDISQGHMHIQADSNRANFVSSLLGESHYISGQKYVPPSADVGGDAISGRALADMLSPRDPDVSTGADCLVVDGDSMLESVVCYEVAKGFMTSYLDVYDDDGSVTVIKGTTAWAVDGGIAFDGQYVVVARGGHMVVLNATASEDYRNASALITYNEDDAEMVHGNLFTTWDIWYGDDGFPAADVLYWSQYQENYDHVGRFNSNGELSFGESLYSLNMTQNSTLTTDGDWFGEGHVAGQYTGGYFDWRLTIDESQYALDGDVKGSMTALLSSNMQPDGAVAIEANILDSNDEEFLDTTTNVMWSSDTDWNVEGNVDVTSLFTSDFADWDNYNSLSFKERDYTLTLEHYDQYGFERMFAAANGTCGGEVILWHFAVTSSELWLDEDKKGTMEMLLFSEVNMPGTVADIRLDMDAWDSWMEMVLSTRNRVQWNSPEGNDWYTIGHVEYLTVMDMPDIVNWNSDGFFDFADSAYNTRLAIYEYGTGDDMYVAVAQGEYRGWMYDWLLTVTSSALYEYSELRGSMNGELSSWIYSEGRGANVTALVVVKDAQANNVFLSDNRFGWVGYGSHVSWGEGGRVALRSEFYYDYEDSDTLSWNIIDNFQFAEQLFDFQFLSLDRDAQMRWAMNGNGKYNGEVQDFIITLDYSELILTDDLYGTAVGEVRSSIPGKGTNGEVFFSASASDPNGVEAMATANKAAWHTMTSWRTHGLVDFNSSFYVDSCPDCGTFITWNVKEHYEHEDGTYVLYFLNEKANGDDLFWLSGEGRYGGEWVDWWLTLDDSDLVIEEKDYGAATGLITSVVRDYGEFADIDINVQAVNDDDVEIMTFNMTVDWSTQSVWSESGSIDYSVNLQVVDLASSYYLGPPFVVYGSDSNEENYESSFIYVCPYDFIEVSLCDYGRGVTCYEDTYISLYKDGVEFDSNDDSCGLCSSIWYYAWDATLWTECSEVEIRFGCYSSHVCSGSANIYQESFLPGESKPLAYNVDFHRYRKLSYGNNKYLHETKLYQSNGQEHMYNIERGTYGGQPLDWYFTVDYAELRYQGVKQGDISLELSSHIPHDGKKADLTMTILCNAPNSRTGVNEEQLNSTNFLSWDGHDSSRYITTHVYTDTYMSTEPEFFLESILDVDNIAKKAEFFLLDEVMGEEKVNMNATAWYSTATGMMTGIDMTFRYEESPLVSANMFLNTQTEVLSLPSAEPSVAPTGEPSGTPSGVPSGEPSGVPTGEPSGAPSSMPSGEPTSQPTAPTGEPSGRPSVQPSGVPSGVPTGEPSGRPSGQPSAEPSVAPTGEPSGRPSGQPSGVPSGIPTGEPTGEPSRMPSGDPTSQPTSPTGQPSCMPSGKPSGVPSGEPSGVPSAVPSRQPIFTDYPTNSPTIYIPVVTVVSFSTLAQMGGITADDMDLPAQQAFLDVTADTMTGVSSSDLAITEMNTIIVRHLRSVDGETGITKRRLGSAVDIRFSTTTTLENSGYSSATELAKGLEEEVAVAYADPATATAFTQEAEALGSATVDSTTTVVLEEPVLDTSSITEEVVRTSAPTVTAAVHSSGDDDGGETTIIVIAVLVPLFALTVLAAAGYVFYRHKNESPAENKGVTPSQAVNPISKSTEGDSPFATVTPAGKGVPTASPMHQGADSGL